MAKHVVAAVDEIPPGTNKLVPIGRHGVGVYNVNGTYAFSAISLADRMNPVHAVRALFIPGAPPPRRLVTAGEPSDDGTGLPHGC